MSFSYSYSGTARRYEIHFPVSKNTFKIYKDYSSTPTAELPLTRLDTLVMNNRAFLNVYKMDLVQKSNTYDQKVRIYYFNTTHGLLRFETFDGEEWNLF
jgi:hypothetical protein